MAEYTRLAETGHVEFFGDGEDSSEIMSRAHAVISFPFTSTTFEALCARIPAFWHDPLARYTDTPYGSWNGVTTHSYNDLLSMILTIEKGDYADPFTKESSLMDPFRDGGAINRFRRALAL
jgi:polysaccharide biosynthesis PFTS motif protein